jgi:Fe-S-cluster containining protein
MSKLSRLRRDIKRKPMQPGYDATMATNGVKGFDLRDAQLTDLDEIRLDAESNELEVTFSLPVGNGENFSTYEETFALGEDDTPDYLKGAARMFAGAIVRAVRERVLTSGEMPCVTCTAPCCARAFEHVEVTAQDVLRMETAGIDIDATIEHYAQESWTGHVGAFKRVPWFGNVIPPDEDDEASEMCCPHLTPQGCGIYEHRPLVCREFSPWTCELYEEDPDKADGKVRLRVVKEAAPTRMSLPMTPVVESEYESIEDPL